ncbi:MAG: fumarate reductase/succinate dehydrogenase flavoprotein subunit [Desulfobulbaceae bacterium]|nr:fumarate reductase/succinate dehydrogenase flavoprotein subunit [Desulfobulbaceae bacterium]
MRLDPKIPSGPLEQKWDTRGFEYHLVNPANRRKYTVLVIGTGLAGASAAATLGELGYNVKIFCLQDSPRRAHSIAAQGGINAAKNYQNDGDSVFRLFHDTIKGGDFRSREANVYRLAQLSNLIIDQCVAQGIPFAREYGGTLANRSFGGAQVSRTFYARGQTGQQLLLGAYSSLMRQVARGTVTLFPRRELMDIIVEDGRAVGILCRNLISGLAEAYNGHGVVLATGGYGNVFHLSTNAMASNVSAGYRAFKKGAGFANPCFVQIHPTCIPVSGSHQSKLTLMSESLRNDGRVWVPKKQGDAREPTAIPEDERDYYLERKYPSFGNLVPRDIASRSAKEVCDQQRGVSETGQAVYLDFQDAIRREGLETIRQKYGNLFQMYQKITAVNPESQPMMIYPAVHYTMGGLWVDYNLMTTIPGLFAIGEVNFSDHGANRLGASALMQGLADGYFVIPPAMGDYLARLGPVELPAINSPAFKEAEETLSRQTAALLKNSGSKKKGLRTVEHYHRELGKTLWDNCGISRNRRGLEVALARIPEIRAEFWDNCVVPGSGSEFNQSLEKAGRVADYLEFSEIMVRDALERKESCGCHLREESMSADNEAQRDDDNFSHVAVWFSQDDGKNASMEREELSFEMSKPSTRNYK